MFSERLVQRGRWAVLLMAGVSLAACASLTTPTYAIHPGAAGALAAPPANSTIAGGKVGGTNAPYQVGGIWYVPHEQPDYDQTGTASWYGDAFNMKATADGEIFDMNQFSAAHTTLPLPSMVEVTNLDNGKKLVVRVNDRGPFVGGRIIDLSRAAARELGYDQTGTAHVRVRYVGPAPLAGPDAGVRMASTSSFAPRYPISRDHLPSSSPSYAYQPAAAPLARRGADDDVVLTSYKAPAPVTATSLGVLPDLRPAAARSSSVTTTPAAHLAAAPAQTFRIQAGAFSDQDNARRAAAQLSGAAVEPFEKNGVTLYRVYVPGPADEVEAYAVRDKVAAAGFADARVVRPQIQ
jgi:rare lipoprotein A